MGDRVLSAYELAMKRLQQQDDLESDYVKNIKKIDDISKHKEWYRKFKKLGDARAKLCLERILELTDDDRVRMQVVINLVNDNRIQDAGKHFARLIGEDSLGLMMKYFSGRPEARLIGEFFIDDAPDNFAAWCISAAHQSNLELAVFYAMMAVQLDKGSSFAWQVLGSLHDDEKDYASAMFANRESLRLDEHNVQARINLAMNHVMVQELEGAIAEFEKVAKESPSKWQPAMEIGVALKNMGELDRALEFLHRAEAIAPNSAPVKHNLAMAYKLKKDYDKALECIDKSLELKPDHANSYCVKSEILLMAGKFNEALSTLKSAMLHIDSPELVGSYGAVLYHMNNFSEAYKYLSKSYDSMPRPDFLKARYAAGAMVVLEALKNNLDERLIVEYLKLCRHSGQVDKANSFLEMVVKDWEMNPVMLVQRALNFRELGDEKQYFETLEKALKISPDSTEVLENLGECYSDKGEFERALDFFNKLFEIKKDASSCFNIGLVYMRKSDKEKAREYFSKALAMDPENFKSADMLAVFLMSEGKFDEADKLLDIGKREKNPINTFNRGACALERDRLNMAISLVKEALDIGGYNEKYLGWHKKMIDARQELRWLVVDVYEALGKTSSLPALRKIIAKDSDADYRTRLAALACDVLFDGCFDESKKSTYLSALKDAVPHLADKIGLLDERTVVFMEKYPKREFVGAEPAVSFSVEHSFEVEKKLELEARVESRFEELRKLEKTPI